MTKGIVVISSGKGKNLKGTLIDVEGIMIITFNKSIFRYALISEDNIENLYDERKFLFSQVKKINKRITIADRMVKSAIKD